MSQIKAAITAVHGEVPSKVLSNQDLEKMVDTNDEWIVTRTGIKERRIIEKGKFGSEFLDISGERVVLKNPDQFGESLRYFKNVFFEEQLHEEPAHTQPGLQRRCSRYCRLMTPYLIRPLSRQGTSVLK